MDGVPPLSPYPVPGERISHYEILDEIARGGMGVVFRALDLNLGRKVALKCPLGGARDNRHRRQFLREARAAARLSHPNIVPVFEVLEDHGVPWLAMDLVDGTSLRAVMASGHPLPIKEVLQHAEELASALEAAHARHILHRDINPNNVMVTSDGRAVLTDFGLAQFLRISEDSATVTHDGRGSRGARQVLGTPHYMSPEQALGQPVDRRSDLFSLGAVIYEMCTGRRAFGGEGDVFDSILNESPIPAPQLNPDVPEELGRIVSKVLAKDRDERYREAGDLLVDLRSLRRRVDHAAYADLRAARPPHTRPPWRSWRGALIAAAVGALALLFIPKAPPLRPGKTRVAVLLLQDLTQRPETASWPSLVQALFVEALTSTGDLAVVQPLSLDVIGHAPVRDGSPPADLYLQFQPLDVGYVIDGTLTAVSDGYRIQANVVQASDREVRFSADAVIQGESMLPQAVAAMGQRVLTFLHPSVLAANEDGDLKPFVSRRPRNVEALKAFVQATDYVLHYQPGARKYLQRAVALDPEYISPRIWLISSLMAEHEVGPATEHYRYLQTVEASASPFDQALIGWAGSKISGDYAAQARYLEIALEYSPGNNILLVTLGAARFIRDDFEGALKAIAGPLRLKWRYPPLYTLQAVCLLGTGQFHDAKIAARDAVAVAAVDPDMYGILAALSWREGDTVQADRYRELYQSRSRDHGSAPAVINEGLSAHLVRVGLYDRAIESLRDAMAVRPPLSQFPGYLTGAVYRSSRVGQPYASHAGLIAARPGGGNGHLVLGRMAETKGDKKAAIDRYEAFLSIEPAGAVTDGVRIHVAALREPK